MKISNELVKIQMKDYNSASDTPKIFEEKLKISIFDALIRCPFCSTTITAFHKPTEVNTFLWNVSNFDGHLELAHVYQSQYIESNTNNDQLKHEALVECDGDRDAKINEKLQSKSIVCYSDTSLEEEDLQSYSEILLASSLGSFRVEQNKVSPTSSGNLNPKCFPKNHAGELTKELHSKL